MSSGFEACPFLGCAEDRASVCSYATGINVCYAQSRNKRTRYRIVPLPHQQSFCLAAYGGCRVHQGALAALGNGLAAPTRPPLLLRALRRLFPPRGDRSPSTG